MRKLPFISKVESCLYRLPKGKIGPLPKLLFYHVIFPTLDLKPIKKPENIQKMESFDLAIFQMREKYFNDANFMTE